jgi:hypothetical protein
MIVWNHLTSRHAQDVRLQTLPCNTGERCGYTSMHRSQSLVTVRYSKNLKLVNFLVLLLCCKTFCVVVTSNYTITFTFNVTQTFLQVAPTTSWRLGLTGATDFKIPQDTDENVWVKKSHNRWHAVSQTATGMNSPVYTLMNARGREGNTSRCEHEIITYWEQHSTASHILQCCQHLYFL